MTDDTVNPPDHNDDDSSPTAMQGALDQFKTAENLADEDDVNDGTGARARMMWNPVTDAGGSPPAAPPSGDDTSASGFHFDLGGALARLSGDEVGHDPGRNGDAPAAAAAPTAPPAPPAQPQQAPPAQPQQAPPAQPQQTPPAQPQQTPPAQPQQTPPAQPQQAPPAPPQPVAPAPAPPPAAAPPAPANDLTPSQSAAPSVDHAPSTLERHETPPTPVERIPESPLPSRAAPAPPADMFADDPPTNYPRRIPGSHLSALHVDPEAGRDPLPRHVEPEPAVDVPHEPGPQSVFGDTVAARARGTAPPPGAVPMLPAANPAAPPQYVEPVTSAPSTPDITALRSAQLRASKQQRQGKLFGRMLLAFVLVGGLLAAALLFGRSLLFQNDWDAALTPIVNEVQEARGADFKQSVPLVTLDAEQFGERLRTSTIGDGWVDRVPEWRALGLTTGTVDEASVTAALVEITKAIYDPASDTIYQLADAEAPDDLRAALESAFDAQVVGERQGVPTAAETVGFTGVSSLESIATRAVETFASGSVDERQSANESLPVPISYELAAVEVLGEPILVAAGVDPTSFTLGTALPENIGAVLDDNPANTPSALLQPGERSVGEPVALGVDDWSLVWGARLPQASVDRLVGIVSGDSYRPIERNGVVCVLGVFQTSTEADGATLFAELLTWAAAAPAESQALATQLGPQRVQLESCDPGADFGIAPNSGTVDALIDRQQLRLTN